MKIAEAVLSSNSNSNGNHTYIHTVIAFTTPNSLLMAYFAIVFTQQQNAKENLHRFLNMLSNATYQKYGTLIFGTGGR